MVGKEQLSMGIDIGTYNSAGAVALDNDKIHMIRSRYGETPYGKNFPSFVLFDKFGSKTVVGRPAKERLPVNPKQVIWGAKRLIGLSYDQAVAAGEVEKFQYDIEKGPGGSILIRVGNERYSPQHIFEFIFREIKEDAENKAINPEIDGPFDSAVISIPAYYDASRIRPIVEAAENAGILKVETIAEPTAAALVYGIDLGNESTILTFDMGAGTLDVSVTTLIKERNSYVTGEVSVSGHEAHGGIDMDRILQREIVKKWGLGTEASDPKFLSLLLAEIERAKIRLSKEEETDLFLPGQRVVPFTRAELNHMLGSFYEQCRNPIRIALEQAHITGKDIDHLLFVGGPTFMPGLRAVVIDELVRQGITKEVESDIRNSTVKIGSTVNPIECVAQGAALLAKKKMKIATKTDPFGYGTILQCDTPPDFFIEAIPVSSAYPTVGSVEVFLFNPSSRFVTVPIVKKIPAPITSSHEPQFKYVHLGDHVFFIKLTGERPSFRIKIELTENRELEVTITHLQRNKSIKFENMKEIEGKPVDLQEKRSPSLPEQAPIPEPPAGTRSIPTQFEDDVEIVSNPPKLPELTTYDKPDFQKAIREAMPLIHAYSSLKNPKIQKKIKDLEKSIELASVDPDDTCDILNDVTELLAMLRSNKIIKESDFEEYSVRMRNIIQR